MSVEVADHEYEFVRLSAWDQFRVVKRIGPVLSQLLGVMFAGGSQSLLVAALSGPAMEAFAKMEDADAEWVVNTCLKGCKRKEPTGWAPILAANGIPMFADISGITLLSLTVKALQEDLAGFFPSAQPPSQ